MINFRRIREAVDVATGLPSKVAKRADRVNDYMISVGEDLQAALDASGKTAEKNLRRHKIESMFRNLGTYFSGVSNPVPALLGIGAVVLLFFILRGK